MRIVNSIRMGVVAALLGTTGCAHGPVQRDETPPCESPARISGTFDRRAPGFIVQLKPTAEGVSVAHELERQYGFEVEQVLFADPVFMTGPMSTQTVARLRCDARVEWISHDARLNGVVSR